MNRVADLLPGDVHRLGGGRWGVHVAQLPHPLYPALRLVIWRLSDGTHSFDALDPRLALATREVAITAAQRVQALRWAVGQGVDPPLPLTEETEERDE